VYNINMKKDLGTTGLLVFSFVLSASTYFIPVGVGVVVLLVAFLVGVISFIRTIKEKHVLKIALSILAIILPVVIYFGVQTLLEARSNRMLDQIKSERNF